MQSVDSDGRRANPERAFVAAWLLDGIRAAQRGEPEAAAWLDEFGPRLSELIGFEFDDWRRAAAVPSVSMHRAARGRRPRQTWAERKARKAARSPS